jgi:hypothetical protein
MEEILTFVGLKECQPKFKFHPLAHTQPKLRHLCLVPIPANHPSCPRSNPHLAGPTPRPPACLAPRPPVRPAPRLLTRPTPRPPERSGSPSARPVINVLCRPGATGPLHPDVGPAHRQALPDAILAPWQARPDASPALRQAHPDVGTPAPLAPRSLMPAPLLGTCTPASAHPSIPDTSPTPRQVHPDVGTPLPSRRAPQPSYPPVACPSIARPQASIDVARAGEIESHPPPPKLCVGS